MENVIGKGAMIFWHLQDKQIENHDQIKKEFFDIKDRGFIGIVVGIRGTRYEHSDIKVTVALEYISSLAKKHNLLNWVFLDPRFANRFLIDKTGDFVDNLITTNRGQHFDGTNPSASKIKDGKYLVRIEWILKRHTHMFIDVSLHYEPLQIEKVFLFNVSGGKAQKKSIKDITKDAKFFVNYNEDYVEIFGETDKKYEGWNVVAFPRFRTNVMDYASPKVQKEFNKFIDIYYKRRFKIDGIAWDEPGYYAEFGRFPVSKYIYSKFKAKYGYDLRDKLYAILLNVDDNSHIKVRNNYYSLIEDFVFDAQKYLWEYAKKKYPDVDSGVHHTWHGEFGGTEDMVHGSFDIWKGLKSVSGGFTDMGGAETLACKGDNLYEHYVSNMVIAKSLAKFGKYDQAYFNLWGVDYDGSNPKYPSNVMDYWVDLMCVFSNKWLAHAYGNTGIMNADRGFGPGYPFHNTWIKFNLLNRKIDTVEKLTKLKPTIANVLLVFPVESLKAIGNLSGNETAKKIHELIYKLTYQGFSIDVISPQLFADGKYNGKEYVYKNNKYRFVICPFLNVIPKEAEKILTVLKKNKFNIYFDATPPKFDTDGKKVNFNCKSRFDVFKEPEKDLERLGLKKLIEGPKSAFTTFRYVGKDIVFTLCPNAFQVSYEGEIRFNNIVIPIEKTNGLTVIVCDSKGTQTNYLKLA
jgi:hypothetical protein